MRKAAVQCLYDYLTSHARLSQGGHARWSRWSCKICKTVARHFSDTSYIRAAIVQIAAIVVRFAAFLRQPCNKAHDYLSVMLGLRTNMSVVGTPCVPCISLAAGLRVLQLSCVLQKSHKNREEK